jgi:dUTP pyrophosphatase
MEKVRGFEIVSKYTADEVLMPKRGTKQSACYDIFNNTGTDIVIEPGAISGAITTKVKAYMLNDEVLMAYVRSGHGFKYSVRLANSTGIIDCVPHGTLISTPHGDIPIEQFMDKSQPVIYSYNEESDTIEIDIIDDIWIVNDLELLKIETEKGIVEVPLNKELYTKRGWIKAKELLLDDVILSFI